MFHRWRMPSLLLPLLALLACTGSSRPGMVGLKGSKQGRSEPGSRPPNVVLVTMDTTRADHLGCYGDHHAQTPNLDRLARESVLFSQAIAQASVTPVSHASILTGLEPYHHGLRVLHGTRANRLADDKVTLAEVLRRAGYRTGAFVSAFPAGSRFGLAQGFNTFDEKFEKPPGKETVSPGGIVNTGLAQRRADETTDRALAWLTDASGASGPVFLWVHYFDPHDPMVVPPARFMAQFPKASGSEEDRLRELYDIEISYMDQQLGRLLEGVRDTLGADRTLTIVTADHGQGLGDHDWWTHGILYQEQIRVPLLIRLPGDQGAAASAGKRVDSTVRSIDLVPTVLQVAGIPQKAWPDPLDGRSLVPLLQPGTTEGDRTAYADSINRLTYNSTRTIRDVKNDVLFALVRPPWKYIHHLLRRNESELYNLEKDPGETHNLYRELPDVVQSFEIELQQRQVMPRLGAEPDDPEVSKRLESLGYVK